jgi:hypothetical protein
LYPVLRHDSHYDYQKAAGDKIPLLCSVGACDFFSAYRIMILPFVFLLYYAQESYVEQFVKIQNYNSQKLRYVLYYTRTVLASRSIWQKWEMLFNSLSRAHNHNCEDTKTCSKYIHERNENQVPISLWLSSLNIFHIMPNNNGNLSMSS